MHWTGADQAANSRTKAAKRNKKTRKDGLRGVRASLTGPRKDLKLILITPAQAEARLLGTAWERRGVTASGSVKV